MAPTFKSAEEYVNAYKKHGSLNAVARAYGVDRRNLTRWVRRWQEEIDTLMESRHGENCIPSETDSPTINTKGDILKLLEKGQSLSDLSTKLNLTTRVTQAYLDDLREQSYVIEEHNGLLFLRKDVNLERNILDCHWDGGQIIRFGLCGDNQSGSKYTQWTHLHRYYDICESEGVSVIYHTGDITEGEEMRQGHKYECYVQGADEHVAEICGVYPNREGIVTRFITGNHDHSLIKRAGYDIGRAIAREREDLEYLGQSYATVRLTPNCTLDLYHPTDGTAYALSYKPQKTMDSLQGGEKPNILAIGHYHKAEYLPIYRNIHCFQTGAFQSQTPWMRTKQIAAHVGGWIVEVHVEKDGTISRCKGEFIPFYRMIKDDWKNWR